MSVRRKVIRIDEEKCDGCGLCIPACPEGALQVVEGKARLVKESYCDGLGACIGNCPKGAMTIEEREADEFDAEGAAAHMKAHRPEHEEAKAPEVEESPLPMSCPGAASRLLGSGEVPTSKSAGPAPEELRPGLVNWPVQLRLVPVVAPYFRNARLLISADCVPFCYADFHPRLLSGRTLLVGCPKLDDAELYRRKLTQIFLQNEVKEVQVVYMEVPCCYGLVHLVRTALEESGKRIPAALSKVSIHGRILETGALQPAGAQGR